MSQRRDRVQRLLEDEGRECSRGDVETRVEELQRLRAEAGVAVEQECRLLDPLGNETRLRLVRVLDAVDRDLCVCELEALADVSESAVSHALSDLTDAGLVVREKRGKWRYYDVTERASLVLSALDEAHARGAQA